METIKNIQKISLVFFVIIGVIHIFAGLLVANNYWLKYAFIINRTLDIPFIIAALGYGLSSIFFHFASNKKPNFMLITNLFALGLIILAGVMYVNLFIPDK